MLCCAVLCLVAQFCLTLWDPMDCSLPGPSVHGILQARIPEGDAISSPGDLPDLGIEPRSPALQANSLPSKLFLSYMSFEKTRLGNDFIKNYLSTPQKKSVYTLLAFFDSFLLSPKMTIHCYLKHIHTTGISRISMYF